MFGAAVALIFAVNALTLDRIIEYREISFQSPRWPQELDGYRIAFITDVHIIGDDVLRGVVNELNTRQLDMLLLGGDFAIRNEHYWSSVAILSEVQTADGIFGVEGNHDGYTRLAAAMEHYGMTVLSNAGLSIHEGFYLAGLEDLWNGNPNIAAAVKNAAEGEFVLLLTHNPDVTMQQDTTAADLILAGHTHGGQITFFGIWAPYFTLRSSITDYGQRFASGWAYSYNGVPVFISNGTGPYYNVPRIFARPQVIMLTMQNGDTVRAAVNMPFWSNSPAQAYLLLAAWNLAVFLMFAADKRNAFKGKRRTAEATLITCALLMGGTGAFFGMVTFRHKTRRPKFKILISLAVLANIITAAVIAYLANS